MKKSSFILMIVMTILSACNLPKATSIPTDETETESTIAPSAVPGKVTQTPVTKPPDLTHHPLYWFGPLPPLPQYTGRMFIGSEDFMQLFESDAPWQSTASQIQVFKLYGEWVSNHPNDAQLKQVIADLNRRGLAIAIETGPLDPDGCGEGVEGFAGVQSSLQMVRAIKSAGGMLHFIGLDEPYFYGHFYDGANACHWGAEKIAKEVGEFITAVREIFPEIIIGDTEPLAGPAGAREYQEWLDTFYAVNGYHLAFIHMDIDWARPNWPEEVKAIQEHGKSIGIPVGIIYNGNAFDPTDEAFLSATGERVKKLELATGVQPDHVIFQSWSDKPDRVLPETEPYTFTGFINIYFTDKEKLGYLREGKGANIALGKPVRVSSLTGDLIGSLAVDGDFGTLWNSGGGPKQWIEVDLGKNYNIAEIRLTISQYPQGKTIHRILGRDANSEFTVLTTFDGNTSDGQTLNFTPPESIHNIRFVHVETTLSPSWVAWREIEIIDAGE